MALLLQCPRCSFNYVLPDSEPDKVITCRRCQLVFDPQTVAEKRNKAAAPPAPVLGSAAYIVSSLSPDFLIEPEPVHEVDHIEVLDPPAEESVHEVEHIEVLDPPPEASPPSAPVGFLELDASPPPTRFDDVEVVSVTADRSLAASKAGGDILIEAVVGPEPDIAQVLTTVEVVEIVEDPAPAPLAPIPQPAPVVDEVEIVEEPLQATRLSLDRSLDIRKRDRGPAGGTSVGVWLGVGLGALALLGVVVIVVVIAMKPTPLPVAQDDAAAQVAQPHQFLPKREEWPQPSDRRGPPPWQPTVPALARAMPELAERPGLVAYWPLDEGNGDFAVDVSPNGLRAAIVGGWWIDGIRGKALLFDGQRDYLELGAAPELNFPHDSPFTIAGWLATRQTDGYILAFRNPRDQAPMLQLKLNGGALCGVVRADGSEKGEARVGLSPVADGRWHHFAVVRHAGGLIEVLLDGQSLDKRIGANTQGPITTTVRAIGCERAWFLSQQHPAAYCACAIDELCIFSRALSVQEVATMAGR